MNEKITVIPAQGLTVIDPANGQALPPEGKEVEYSIYWIRRLNEGDVVQAAEGKAPVTSGTSGTSAKSSKNKE